MNRAEYASRPAISLGGRLFQAYLGLAEDDRLAGTQLCAFARLDAPVDRHLAGLDCGMGFTTTAHQTGRLE